MEEAFSGTARWGLDTQTCDAECDTGGQWPVDGTALLIVDPQQDFHEHGPLAVPGANADAERVAKLVTDHLDEIDEIVVTLDSHHCLDIAHPHFWRDESGTHPTPYTRITADEVESRRWVPVQREHLEHCIEYTRRLEERGRFTLCIWPEHCLIGTPGHAINSDINEAIQEWAVAKTKNVTYFLKGQHTLSEHYSCFAAEVPVAEDDANERGQALLNRLCAAERVLVCGQASSHCLNHSARDLADAWTHTTDGFTREEAGARMANLIVLRDGTSPVPNFENEAARFFQRMVEMGVSVRTCSDAFDL